MTSAKQLAWLHADDKSWQEWFLQLETMEVMYTVQLDNICIL